MAGDTNITGWEPHNSGFDVEYHFTNKQSETKKNCLHCNHCAWALIGSFGKCKHPLRDDDRSLTGGGSCDLFDEHIEGQPHAYSTYSFGISGVFHNASMTFHPAFECGINQQIGA